MMSNLRHEAEWEGTPAREPWGRGALIPAFLPQLNGSAVLGPAVRLLRLPRRGARPPLAGTRCRVSGWGFTSDFEEPPPALMEAEVRVLDLSACNRSWQGQLSPAMLCTRSGDRRWRGFCSVRWPGAGETEAQRGQGWT